MRRRDDGCDCRLVARWLLLAAVLAVPASPDLVVNRDPSRPDTFWSTLASNCQDEYCTDRRAIAAGYCTCQCPAWASTLEISSMSCVPILSNCDSFFVGNTSSSVQTVYAVASTIDLQPLLGLYMNTSDGNVSRLVPVASSLACDSYLGALYQASDGSWQPLSVLDVSSTPFAVRDNGQNMYLQWLPQGQTNVAAGKIVQVQLGCGQRGNPNAFRMPYCVAVKFKGQDTVPDAVSTAKSTGAVASTAAPFVKTPYFVVIICVLAAAVFLAALTCVACCLRTRKVLRGRDEMVVFAVTTPGDGTPVPNGHVGAGVISSAAAAPNLANGVSMHPGVGGGRRPSLDIPDAAAASSLTRSQAYRVQTQDQLHIRSSQDSGFGPSPPSRGTQSGNEQSSGGGGSDDAASPGPAPDGVARRGGALDRDELQRNLLYFEGTRFAHEKRSSPRELFKSHSERLTTVRASLGGNADGDRQRDAAGGVVGGASGRAEGAAVESAGFAPATNRFLSQRWRDGGPRRRGAASAGGRGGKKVRRSRSARHAPGASAASDSESDSSVGFELAHFGADPEAPASLRSPRKFSDDHVNKDVKFNPDGTVAVPDGLKSFASEPPSPFDGPSGGGGSRPPPPPPGAAGDRRGRRDSAADDELDRAQPLYATVSRPSQVSFSRATAAAGRVATPVTEIDDIIERDEPDASAMEATARRPPPPPPTRPPPALLLSGDYSVPDDARAEGRRVSGLEQYGGDGRRYSQASKTSTLRR